MDASLRIVTRTPLQELWRSDGSFLHSRGRTLTAENIRELLRSGPVEFVIADVGSALNWVPTKECHTFWKTEVKTHVANPAAMVRREDFPGEYFYFASQWRDPESSSPIVLLEKHH